ncbi:bifunctional 4-hydroxy-2-oxoglutarate aldolase/2-dehydro-3-deoxy-phosphogluconate aldolase [Deinococcus knuensis]|uniref:2-dehydro-3-deoxy-phosphogluconate aldolase n=1 Tax=Deinococcus knuensis TaxID=1837380 RepID=A0ABQ2SW30_9DEIO|nr:bifunctional 4-hydroxy-2-oxoglutarate aldolase/2-dehydro-3-deoxy-phosphogluconate aldolase [Deinococcus knuensis]GGS39912.1 2-dehydro-3-deoxy-phosphogluconate aldolase [Deinococcus knuensis]
MPAETRTRDLLAQVSRAGVVGVLRAPHADAAVQATLAATRAGLQVTELTFTTPGVTDALHALSRALPAGTLLGAGTVMNAAQATAAIEAGAAFLVSPHLGEDVLRVALEAGVPYLPGVLTPTEIVRALTLGAPAVKLFPAGSAGGAAYLRDLLGPLPQLQVMVTGGVRPDEVEAYRHAGALAVGLGSNLYPKAALTQGDWLAVEHATRAALIQAGAA